MDYLAAAFLGLGVFAMGALFGYNLTEQIEYKKRMAWWAARIKENEEWGEYIKKEKDEWRKLMAAYREENERLTKEHSINVN